MSNKFRHIQTKSTGALALCVGLAFGLSGCNKDDQKPQPGAKVADQDKQHHANGPQAPEKRVESVAAELVTSLDAEYQIELARSTGGESVTLPWHEATATAVAAPRKPGDEDRLGGAPREGVQNTGKPDQPGAPHSSDDKNAAAKNGDDKNSPVQVGGPPAKREPRQWLATTVLVGRTNVYLDGKAIGPVRCHADAGLCDATALRASTGKQAFDFDPAQMNGDQYKPLADAAAALRGKSVWLLVDRRISFSAVEAARRTLAANGAIPVLAVASYSGELVRLLPDAVLPPVGPAVGATTTADESKASAGEAPDDLTAVLVHVTEHGLSLELQRKGGEPMTPELLGNVLETLSAWALKLRGAMPTVATATVAIEALAPFEEVVRAVDGLRDTCAAVAKGTPCHDRRGLYRPIELLLQAAEEKGKPGAEGKADAPVLLLDVPAGGAGLHFENPAAGGMHLTDDAAPAANAGRALEERRGGGLGIGRIGAVGGSRPAANQAP